MIPTRPIAAIQNQDGRLEVFAIVADGSVESMWQTRPFACPWVGRASLGGVVKQLVEARKPGRAGRGVRRRRRRPGQQCADPGLLAAAVILYAVNLLATLARAAHVSLTGAYVIAALGYLVLAACLGFALAYNLHRPYLYIDHVRVLRAHAHAAGLGFFGLLVMGVAYRLLEMFLLSHVRAQGPGWVALAALNLALAALLTNFVFGQVAVLTWFGVAAALLGVAAFLLQVRRLYRARIKRSTDAAWLHSLASFGYLRWRSRWARPLRWRGGPRRCASAWSSAMRCCSCPASAWATTSSCVDHPTIENVGNPRVIPAASTLKGDGGATPAFNGLQAHSR